MPWFVIWIIRKYKQSIQFRLTSFFLIILLPLIALSLFANFRSQRILEQKVNEQTAITFESALDSFDSTMRNMEMMSMALANDPNLNDLLSQEEEHMTALMTLDFQKILAQLSNMYSANGYLKQLSIFHAYSGTIISSRYGSNYSEGLREQAWYEEAIQGGGKSMLLIPKLGDYSKKQEIDAAFQTGNVTLLRPMDPLKRAVQKHILMITIGSEHFVRDLGKLVHGEHENAYLFASDGQLVGGTAPIEQLPKWDDDSTNSLIRQSAHTGEKLLMMRYRSVESGWTVVLVKPVKEMYAQTYNLRWITYAIIGVSFLLTLLISVIVYRGIAAPLTSLAFGMKQLQLGRLDTSLLSKREDEFGYLMTVFNKMAREQKYLIEDIYEQQLLRLKAELHVLQSQINPHFLYNTLDSIYSMAENYEAEEISEMAISLSKFFRLSLSKGQEEFSVKETVEHLYYYLRVQELRFVDRLSVSVTVEEACNPVPVLKLLLQPLVENAILHGLEKKAKGGQIRIDCRIENDQLRLQVSDDGKGITTERLRYIRQELDQLSMNAVKRLLQEQQPRKELYGLWNVKARLKLYYGELADLVIDSEENVGTTVTLWIPLGGTYESNDRGGRNSASE